MRRRRKVGWIASLVSWRRHGRRGLIFAALTGIGTLAFWLQAGTGEAVDFCAQVGDVGRYAMPIDRLTPEPASCEPIWSLLLLGFAYYSLAAFPAWTAIFSAMDALGRFAQSRRTGTPGGKAYADAPLFSAGFIIAGAIVLFLFILYAAIRSRIPVVEAVAALSAWGTVALGAAALSAFGLGRRIKVLGDWFGR